MTSKCKTIQASLTTVLEDRSSARMLEVITSRIITGNKLAKTVKVNKTEVMQVLSKTSISMLIFKGNSIEGEVSTLASQEGPSM